MSVLSVFVVLLFGIARPVVAAPQVPLRPDVSQEAPTVVELDVRGLTATDSERVAALLGFVVGQAAPSPQRQSSGVERIWNDYGILVTPDNGVQLDEAPGGVKVTLNLIEPRVDLDPKFVGNATFPEEKLREWAQLDERTELFLQEAPGVVNKLEEAYRRQGFAFVEVEAVVGGIGTQRDDVIFEIREGPKVRVTDVVVEGNDNVPDTGWWLWRGGLRKLAGVKTRGRGLFAWLGRKYVREELEADLVAMREVYRNLGYLDAKVELDRIDFRADRRRAVLHIRVDEGPRYHASSVDIVGVEVSYDADREPVYTEVPLVLDEARLREVLELEPGKPLERARIDHDERELRTQYGEEGHLDAELFEGPGGQRIDASDSGGWRFHPPELVYDVENKKVAVTYRVQQGRPLFVRAVEFEGNHFTRNRVLRREVDQLPGERADLDKILRSLRRIRGLGFFDDERDLRHRPPDVRFVPVEGEPDQVDVIFGVEDGRTIDANISGGVASDQGLVGLLTLSIRNFDWQAPPSSPWRVFQEVYRKEAYSGDGERLSIDIAPGSEVSYWRFLYSHPDVFGTHFDRITTTFEALQRERRFRSHDEDRTRLRLTFGRLFGTGDLRASWGLQYQEVEVEDLETDDVLPRTLVASEGKSTYLGFTGALSYDQLDNRFSPRDGWSARWSNTLYLEDLGGDEDLWVTDVEFDWYQHLNEDELDAGPGWHLGLSTGVAVGFGSGSNFVNYSERFFLGGSQRLRGFRFRGVGPYEGDYSLGGETYLSGTVEYRFPLYTEALPGTDRRREVLRGGFFVDYGILDPDAWELDLAELRVTAGFQFGLTAPFPITFNFGWPLESEETDEEQVFSFRLSFGR